MSQCKAYPRIKIKKFASVKGGKRIPLGKNLVTEKTEHPYIRARDIGQGIITFNDPVYVTNDVFEEIKNYTVKTNDVCITIVGAYVGDVGIVPTSLSGANLTENAVKLTSLIDCDPFFLKYGLLTEEAQSQMKLYAAGAAQPKLGLYKIKEVEIPFPDLTTQRKISSVLRCYDNLIENNTRRIQILEEMARRIYEEWFVHFRFPGHENFMMVESELGLAPEDWKVQSVSQMIEFDPRTFVPKEGIKPFVPMSSLAENSMLISNIESREGNSGSKFKNGDTLFARITPCLENGKTGFVDFLPDEDAVAFGSTEYIVLRSKTVTPEFVYLTARSERFRQHAIKSMSGATGRQRVRIDSFKEYLLVHPDKETLDQFSDIVSPTFKSVSCLAKKNANLRRTRDLLLPKLISGEIDVSNFPEPVSDLL